MQSAVAQVSRHLKQKTSMSTKLPAGAKTREKACSLIKDFWQKVWVPTGTTEEEHQAHVTEAILATVEAHLRSKTLPRWHDEEA